MIRKYTNLLTRWSWLLLVLSLPVTSQPLVARLARTGSVAPLSGIFLAVLFLFWFLPFLFRGGRLPKQSAPILIFAGWAVLVTLTAFFRDNPPYKDIPVLTSSLKGLSTLAIGLIFYLVAATYIRSATTVKITLQLINWGGVLIIVWSLSQVLVNRIHGDYFHWMDVLQSYISTGVLARGRASGFTLEPSWLAHQLNMLYLPFWLAAAVCRYTAHSFRIWKFHFEDFLLILGIASLMGSFSRVGLLAFLLMIAFVFLLVNLRLIRRIERIVLKQPAEDSSTKRVLLRVGLVAGLILVYAGLLFLVGQVFLRFDPRMQTLFQFNQGNSDPILRYANSLKFGERLVYWMAAWKIFGSLPWTGVGLGLAGYYFPNSIVAYGWSLTEVKKLFFHSATLLNIKSIWFRLLAETGIIGFSMFLSWLFVIFVSSIKLFIDSDRMRKTAGLMGILVMIGFLMEGFSIDSFAMPYWWFSAGLITAVYPLRDQSQNPPVNP